MRDFYYGGFMAVTTSYEEFVSVDEFNTNISDDEYSLILDRQKRKEYINDPFKDDTGNIIDANECLLEGMKILADSEIKG